LEQAEQRVEDGRHQPLGGHASLLGKKATNSSRRMNTVSARVRIGLLLV
jgi:hypothetical protein